MAIILDADVIISGERGGFDLGRWLEANAGEAFEIAAVTVAELWHGAERATGSVRSRRERYLRAAVSALPIIPYTEQTAYEHARLWAALEDAGKMIGYYDLIVAATAIERSGAVATFNRKHFQAINGLRVIDPSAA